MQCGFNIASDGHTVIPLTSWTFTFIEKMAKKRGDGLVFIFSFPEPRAKNTLPELLKIW